MKNYIILSFSLLIYSLSLSVGAESRTYQVDLSKLVEINLIIPSSNREEPYLFWCSGGPVEATDKLSDETGLNHVGPLMCVFHRGAKRLGSSLLGKYEGGPWHSGGMFTSRDLIEGVKGIHRKFTAGGNAIELGVSNIKYSSYGKPLSLSLAVSITKLNSSNK